MCNLCTEGLAAMRTRLLPRTSVLDVCIIHPAACCAKFKFYHWNSSCAILHRSCHDAHTFIRTLLSSPLIHQGLGPGETFNRQYFRRHDVLLWAGDRPVAVFSLNHPIVKATQAGGGRFTKSGGTPTGSYPTAQSLKLCRCPWRG